MWQEARKQEKKVRSMIVDYRKRAERRREFYEKFKADPTQCIQLHGRPCKIYMDPAITTAADDSLLVKALSDNMPWQGNKETIIDRFDVRAHLDYIPDTATSLSTSSTVSLLDHDLENLGELNYERYRILVQNELTNLSEDKFLHQIHIEEKFGSSSAKDVKGSKTPGGQPKAAIPYTYSDSSVTPDSSYGYAKSDAANDDESEDDLDFDLLVNLNDLNTLQKMELNTSGTKYGMKEADFMTYLTKDVKEREHQKLLKIQEEEKQQMSGRKARRERRAYKDRQLSRRENYSPPSYATALEDALPVTVPVASNSRRSTSGSRSSESPERITYITSFGTKTDGNSIFGPNLPNSYKGTKYDPPRKKNRRSSRSTSPEYRRRKRNRRSSSPERSSRYKRSSHRRRRSSSTASTSSSPSSSSSSSNSSFRRRSSRRRSRSRSPNQKSSRGRKRSHSQSSSSGNSKHHSHRSSVGNGSRGCIEKVITNSSSKEFTSSSRRPGTGITVNVGESCSSKLTPQERLKRRMQAALNKQLKTDKEAEKARLERLEQERLDREETLREISIRHRRRERERRHEQAGNTSDSTSGSRSRSRSVSPP